MVESKLGIFLHPMANNSKGDGMSRLISIQGFDDLGNTVRVAYEKFASYNGRVKIISSPAERCVQQASLVAGVVFGLNGDGVVRSDLLFEAGEVSSGLCDYVEGMYRIDGCELGLVFTHTSIAPGIVKGLSGEEVLEAGVNGNVLGLHKREKWVYDGLLYRNLASDRVPSLVSGGRGLHNPVVED